MFSNPRGTKDILPDEIGYWHRIEKVAHQVFSAYNYQELRTPIFESTQLFERSIGNQTDIVEKEMYTFLDKGNRSLTLRPEGTAPVVRSYIQNGLHKQQQVSKLYYCGPMFRYERPQAGRYRQFHQIGVECLGSALPFADAETIALGVHLFDELGLSDLSVNINSVGCSVCRPVIEERLKQYLSSNLSALCEDCNARFESRPLRILDCKKPQCQPYFSAIPNIRDSLCQACNDHFSSLLEYLAELGIEFNINPRLVRGLDYYSRTTFEIISDKLGAQNAICGGGRYDTLVEKLGGPATPAVGFAFGVERAVIILRELEDALQTKAPNLFIAPLGENQRTKSFYILNELRRAGIQCEMDYTSGSLKAQLKQANRYRSEYTLIFGEEEAQREVAILKKMINGDQVEVPLDQLVDYLVKTINQQ